MEKKKCACGCGYVLEDGDDVARVEYGNIKDGVTSDWGDDDYKTDTQYKPEFVLINHMKVELRPRGKCPFIEMGRYYCQEEKCAIFDKTDRKCGLVARKKT